MDDNLDSNIRETKYKEYKLSQKPKQFCTEMSCTHLIPFAEAIYALEFKEKPDYAKLKFLLTKELLNVGMIPNKQFDWNSGLV